MKMTKEAIKFLNDNRIAIETNTQEKAEEWYLERYNTYKKNWKSFEIETRFSQSVLIYNLECDIENFK